MIQSCQHRATVIFKSKANKKSKARQPWATAALLNLVEAKSQAYKQWRKDKTNSILGENFRRLSKSIKKETRKAQTYYYSKLLDESKIDPKNY